MTTWIVNTNSNTCHIYDYKRAPGRLTLIKKIVQPENRLKDTELISDAPGHYMSRISNRGTYSQQTDPKKHKIDIFAHNIADYLKQKKHEKAFERLILIAEPHMNGLLFNHLDPHICQMIAHNIQKDVIFLKEHELLNFLNEQI